jgi:hypothetical protein
MSGTQQGEPVAPDDAQAIRAEIEQTRERLGATVEQLAAKADVKSRVRAQGAELARQVRSRASRVTREQPVPLAAAAAGALAAVFLVIWQRRRR